MRNFPLAKSHWTKLALTRKSLTIYFDDIQSLYATRKGDIVIVTFASWIVYTGLPVVALYHMLCNSPFFQVAAQDASGIEKTANIAFIPLHYLLAGKSAIPIHSSQYGTLGYQIEQRFTYQDATIWWKTAAAYLALPSSLMIGTALKTLSLTTPLGQNRYKKITHAVAGGGHILHSHHAYYTSMGIHAPPIEQAPSISHLGCQRRNEDLHILQEEKEALRVITSLLHQANILYWLDCGTCLGAYRYGGAIPWDWDIDIAVLQKDFSNVRCVLSRLDPKKYALQDWSSRDRPNSYLKVYVKKTRSLIDIYHFSIDEENHTIQSILSNENSIFLPDTWKIRERRFIIPTPISWVFPLKKALFDGIEAFVPNEIEKYLQQRYGKDLRPAKIYHAATQSYEKDPSHPYWNIPFAR